MDLLNLMYRYINRFINNKELYNGLKTIDLSKYTNEETEIIKKLIVDIKNVIDNVPNEPGEFTKIREFQINQKLEFLKAAKDSNTIDIKGLEFINNEYNNLLKEKEKACDDGQLYQSLFHLMTNNSLVSKYCREMTDKELFEFITKYISVPMPPNINQDAFNDLVKVGIKEDERELLWRLAFNYNHKNMDFSLIEDYFIEKRDYYYLVELIDVVPEDLDIEKLIDKIIKTKDKEFIGNVIEDSKEMNALEQKYLDKLLKEIS